MAGEGDKDAGRRKLRYAQRYPYTIKPDISQVTLVYLAIILRYISNNFRTMNDKLGEAKASGNLGNTLKVMGKFAEAIQCCKRHLEISRALGDKLSEGRALYNLGNVYHAQGKQLGRVGQNDPGHFPQEVRECLMQAVTYYESVWTSSLTVEAYYVG